MVAPYPCYYSPTIQGILILFLIFAGVTTLDTFINIYLSKKVDKKNIILLSSISLLSWLLLIETHSAVILSLLTTSFPASGTLFQYLIFILPPTIIALILAAKVIGSSYSRKKMIKKKIAFDSVVLIIAWLLLAVQYRMLAYYVPEYLTYVFTAAFFILFRMFLFKKLFRMHYVKSIVSSVVILILLGYFITQTFDIINRRYNWYCPPSPSMPVNRLFFP